MKRKILCTIAVVTIIGMNLCMPKVLASTGTVTVDGLRVRSSASSSGEVIGSYNKGASITINGEEGNWYKVTFNGSVGYVSKDYVNTEEVINNSTTNNTDSNQANVTTTNNDSNQTNATTNNTDSNNTNSTTTNNSNKTDSNADNKTNSENETEKSDEGNGSETENVNQPIEGKTSYEAKINSDSTVYVLPLLNSTKLFNLDKDAKVTVMATAGEWVYVHTEKGAGWIFASRINVGNSDEASKTDTNKTTSESENTSGTDTKTNNESSTSKTMYIKYDSVNVRSEANTTSSIVTILTKNTAVTVTSEEGEWYKVTVDSKSGHIRKDLLSSSKS